ncbi:MAG TPA: D-alanyl-D-alanine carboxypeptidase/D-alanyl-D-alanine-endopeptidase [Conexibacter sp.]|jgi:D-alanyl-D-alanine carboxypeptidase/D-alanyl-D-alanine-endopeptidase (penicillin-binding protein 4)
MRRLALLAAATSLAAPLVAQTATATASAAPLDAAVSTQLKRMGGVSGGYVLDTTTGRVLASVRADTARIPASVEKLYTTSTALLRFGADGTLDTSVLGSGSLGDDGTWHGDLYLHGEGDPTFASQSFVAKSYGIGTSMQQLADTVADAGITRVTGRVYGDESWFDLRRGGPSTKWAYDLYIGGGLSALLYDRGLAKEDGTALQAQPALFTAQQLTRTLKADGVRVMRPAMSGTTPEGAQPVAEVPSPPMSTLVRLTLGDSDNLYAEQLLKAIGARYGTTGSTPAGVSVVKQTIKRFGIAPRIVDGSGLSRGDATTPRMVVTLLNAMGAQPGFRSSMPVAGRTGTLENRMRGTSAQDRCQAKTGTLSNVSGLAGYCRTANNHVVAFSFMSNNVSTTAAKAAEDRLAIMLARQRPAGTALTTVPTTTPATPTPTPTPTQASSSRPATGGAASAPAR